MVKMASEIMRLNKTVAIIVPYMSHDYQVFKMIDVLWLNKIISYLKRDDIKITTINPNEDDLEPEITAINRNLIKITESFSTKQNWLREYLNVDTNAEMFENIFKEIIVKLKLSEKKVVLYYQPYFDNNVYTYLMLLKILKRKFQDINIICVGTYFFRDPEFFLKKFPFIDCIPNGMREDFLAPIVNGISKVDIPGITFRENNEIKRGKDSPYDFKNAPMPDHFSIVKSPEIVQLEYSIGCPHNCFFCENKGFEQNYQIKEVDFLMNEIELITSRNIKNIWFSTAAMNINEDHMKNLCAEIIRRNIGIRWAGPIIPSVISKETLKLLFQAGCRHLKIGVETINSSVLRSFDKDVNLNNIVATLKNMVDTGIHNTLTFMIGLPGEADSDLNKKLAFIKRNAHLINSVQFYIFQLRVGAPIFYEPEKYGIKIRNNSERFTRYVKYDLLNGKPWETLIKEHEQHLKRCSNFIKELNIPETSPENYFTEHVLKNQHY